MTTKAARRAPDPGAIALGYVDTPIGLVEIGGDGAAIAWLRFVDARREGATSTALVDEAVGQVAAYFAGRSRAFDLPLDLAGTTFQRAVWARLLRIPFGATLAYRDVAAAIGRATAARAVGAAVARNPVSIIVPCHRVLGARGELTGFAGGVWRKEWLLRHEGAVLL